MEISTGKYLMTPAQHRLRAEALRCANPQSRAAQLHDIAAAMQEKAAKPNAPR
jgi:hypothetical protein